MRHDRSERPLAQQWTTLSEDRQAGPAVLAVDFDATGRKEATFHDLVQLLAGSRTVRLSVQPPDSHQKALSPDEYLSWWGGEALGSPEGVGAVLGYCAGSLFACSLADEAERRQGFRPRVVLFNPGKPDATTLKRDFDGTVESMSLLKPDERDAFLARAAARLAETAGSFGDACEAVLDLYDQASGITFERAGIDADVGAELMSVFRSYASYLRAARRVDYRPEWASATALLSTEHVDKPVFAHRELPTGVARERLLADPQVARAVSRLLSTEAGS